jgi:Na+-driven multidrug efflux pump
MIISAYLYSTKRTNYAIMQNLFRSFVFTITIIFALPAIFGSGVIWYTFGIYESFSFIVALILLKVSERNGVIYK